MLHWATITKLSCTYGSCWNHLCLMVVLSEGELVHMIASSIGEIISRQGAVAEICSHRAADEAASCWPAAIDRRQHHLRLTHRWPSFASCQRSQFTARLPSAHPGIAGVASPPRILAFAFIRCRHHFDHRRSRQCRHTLFYDQAGSGAITDLHLYIKIF